MHRILLSALLFTCTAASVFAQHWSQTQKLTGNPRHEDQYFGSSVAMDGQYAFISASNHDFDNNEMTGPGSVSVYRLEGDTLAFHQLLIPPVVGTTYGFGNQVALSGDWAAITSIHDTDEDGENIFYSCGAIYLYKKVGDNWQFQQKLVHSDRTDYDMFGQSIAMSGDHVVVGAIWQTTDANGQDEMSEAGATYVFQRVGDTWSQQQKLVAHDRASEDRYGAALSLDGNRVFVSATESSLDENSQNEAWRAGAVYVYELQGGTWQHTQKLVCRDRESSGFFGGSMSAKGEMLVVGAYSSTDENQQNGIPGAGAAYIFGRNADGWQQLRKVVAPTRQQSAQFGSNVIMSGDHVLIGAPGDATELSNQYGAYRAGAVYLYRMEGWNLEYVQGWRHTDNFTDDFLGRPIAMHDGFILAGTSTHDYGAFDQWWMDINRSGAAYLFKANPLTASTTVMHEHCQGAADGRISVMVEGGLGPFQFALNGGATQSSPEFYGLASGNYSIVVTDALGANATASAAVNSGSSACAGQITLVPTPEIDYFDTITVSIGINNGSNLFSVYAKLRYDHTLLRFVNYTEEGFLGETNVIATPPILTDGVIDFGVTKTSGQPGTNGSGAFFTFRFVLKNLPLNVPFSSTSPEETSTQFSLTDITVYDATGLQRQMDSPQPEQTTLRYFVPVWPGDLNNDLKVNVADILPIGYFYNLTGPARPNASLQWIGQPARLWGFDRSQNNSTAYRTFADGNGNGLIDLADQSAIGFNLGQQHGFPVTPDPTVMVENRALSAQMTVDIAPTEMDSTQLPTMLSIPIAMSNTSFGNGLYGLAFDILFDPAKVELSTIELDFANSVFGQHNVDYIRILDLHPEDGRLSIGMTRYNTTAIDMYGELLTLNLQLRAQAQTGFFVLRAVPLAANDIDGLSIEMASGRDSVYLHTVVPNGLGNPSILPNFRMYPNPANDIVDFNGLDGSDRLMIFDAAGRRIVNSAINSDRITLSTNTLHSGVYIVEAHGDERVVRERLVIQR
jgi:hypothetical protein